MDRRDPGQIGQVILNRDKSRWPSASEFADEELHHYNIPDVDPGESTCTSTQRQYRDDLIEAAKGGDENAYQRLREIDPAVARTLAFTYKATHVDHQVPESIARDVETTTHTGLDANGDATHESLPHDVDEQRCLSSYESMDGPLYRCTLVYGHSGQHADGVFRW